MTAPIRSANMALLISASLLAGAIARNSLGPTYRQAPIAEPARRVLDVRYFQPMSASGAQVDSAVKLNLFSPERQPAAVRYGDVTNTNVAPTAAPRSPVRSIRLLGTTMAGSRSFALVEPQPGQPVKMLRLNDTIASFKVIKIERGKLVLATRDSTLVFDLNRGK